MAGPEPKSSTHGLSWEEDLAEEKCTMLCKASMAFSDQQEYMVTYFLIKQAQQVFKNLLFMELLARVTAYNFFLNVKMSIVSMTAVHECGMIISSESKDLLGAP